jgi:hypothetical protein
MSESYQNTETGNNNDSNKGQQQKVSQFSEIATKLVDKLVDKDVSVTYTFNKLEIDIPSAHGPGGRELGGAKWVIDGKINIATTSTTHDREPSSSDASKY